MMSKDHILLLAGRKEYTPMLGNSNRWQHINNPSDLTSLSEASSLNVTEEVLERCLGSSPSVDCSSLHSFESSTSDVNDPVVLRKSRTLSTSSTPTKRFVDNRSIDSYIHNGTVDDHQLIQSSSMDSFKSIGKRVRMDEWLDGWMDGWMDGWTDGRTDGWTDGRTDGWMDGWIHVHG